MMIEYNPQKYHVRDECYSKECNEIVSEIESVFYRNSCFGYKNLIPPLIAKLQVLIEKNEEDYQKYYLSNITRFEILNERVSWEFEEPYSEFEASIKPILQDVTTLLKEKKYSENRKASYKLDEAEKLLEKYIEETKLVDTLLRKQINSRISSLKRIFSGGSLFSFMYCDRLYAELELLFETNLKQYERSYRKLVQKIDILHRAFEKSVEFFSPKEKKDIQEQFAEIEKIMNSQSYEKFEDARDILDVIDVKLSDISTEKEKIISDNIKSKLIVLRKTMWLEDWDRINDAAMRLLEQSQKTGTLYNLNLDKFKTDQMEVEKKKEIFDFKMIVKAKNYSNSSVLIQKADSMLSGEFYKKDFEELKRSVAKIRVSRSKTKGTEKDTFREKKNRIRLMLYSLLVLAIVLLFIYNNSARTEHNEKMALKYLDVIETLVYSQKRLNRPVLKQELVRRINFPTGDMEIVSVNEREIVITYSGKEYRKKVRSGK